MTSPLEQCRDVLKPCPFCGAKPGTLARPDNIDGSEFYAAVFCHCDGYSATAHAGRRGKTQDEATSAAHAAWNPMLARAMIVPSQRLWSGAGRCWMHRLAPSILHCMRVQRYQSTRYGMTPQKRHATFAAWVYLSPRSGSVLPRWC